MSMERSGNWGKPPEPYQYSFRKFCSPKEEIACCKRIHLYKFRGERQLVYLVEVHELLHDLYVVKFYQKNSRHSPKRFSHLTGERYVRRIISTCSHIAGDVTKKNPNASFGFMGALKEKEEKAGKTGKSSRYRVYKLFCFFFISREKYHHAGREEHNLHLLLNKTVYPTREDAQRGAELMSKMIDENYDVDGYLRSLVPIQVGALR